VATVTLFSPSDGDGGVDRMLVNLATGLDAIGVTVQFVISRPDNPFLGRLSAGVQVLTCPQAGEPLRRWLADHLAGDAPAALLSARLADDEVAVAARASTATPTRVYLRVGTTFSARQRAQRRHLLARWWENRRLRRVLRRADRVLCVSSGVAEDLQELCSLPPDKLAVLPNPVITEDLPLLAAAPVDHPWLAADAAIPVVIGIGRLATSKNFPLLLQAFARVRKQRPTRLLVLGEGRQRARLLALSHRLSIASDVDLPGFVSNPYAYLARAAAFVLSSNVEGSPNALVEALACGCPVVATDCPSGPREILQGGRLGRLVPLGDPRAMAEAILATLDGPRPGADVAEALAPYEVRASARAYALAMGLSVTPAGTPPR
jgi:glycosyltransferase involved in cell wall biosynthesis